MATFWRPFDGETEEESSDNDVFSQDSGDIKSYSVLVLVKPSSFCILCLTVYFAAEVVWKSRCEMCYHGRRKTASSQSILGVHRRLVRNSQSISSFRISALQTQGNE